MATRYAPFNIIVTYVGAKSDKELQKTYSEFYIDQVKAKLIDSNMSDSQKKEVIVRLADYHSQSALGT